MGLETNLIFLVVFGFVGYSTEKIWGVNPAKIFSDICAMILILMAAFFVLPVVFNPNNVLSVLERLPKFLENVLPGAIVGDVAGTIVSRITQRR